MMRTFLVLVSLAQLVWSEVEVKAKTYDQGKWVVGDCFMGEFAMTLTIDNNTTLTNQTVYHVPPEAVADKSQKNCGNETNTLSLTWTEKAINDSSVTDLKRKLDITFRSHKNISMYGVSSIVATFELARFNETVVHKNQTNTTTHSSSLEQVWQGPLMFKTPLDRSFLCANIDTVSLKASLRYDGSFRKTISNTSLTGHHVSFDAFRPKDNVPSGFRTPMNCDYKPNDIIPIAVGVALAALVVAVLVAYMVGRRRNMQRGYQSV